MNGGHLRLKHGLRHKAPAEAIAAILKSQPGAASLKDQPSGELPLHLGLRCGAPAGAIAALLRAHPSDTDAVVGGELPLHVAARLGLAAVAEALLAGGADPTAVDAAGASPQSIATREGNSALLAVLAAQYPADSPSPAEPAGTDETGAGPALPKLERAAGIAGGRAAAPESAVDVAAASREDRAVPASSPTSSPPPPPPPPTAQAGPSPPRSPAQRAAEEAALRVALGSPLPESDSDDEPAPQLRGAEEQVQPGPRTGTRGGAVGGGGGGGGSPRGQKVSSELEGRCSPEAEEAALRAAMLSPLPDSDSEDELGL